MAMWRVVRPDAVKVWEKKEVKDRLSRYYAIMKDERIAKFLIAKKVPIEIDLSGPIEKLWTEHEKMSKEFKEILTKVDQGELIFKDLKNPKTSYLDLKIELGKRIMSECHLCERRCGINRSNGEIRYCNTF